MAPPAKFRNKRASSSYGSTLTTVGFIALCLFGVWMLTSDSMVPPDTSSAVIVEDPATARLLDKPADLQSKSSEPDLSFSDNDPKPVETLTNPDTQPPPENGGGDGENNADRNQEDKQESTETRDGDQETKNSETNAAETNPEVISESKEEIQQPEDQNQDQDLKSNQNQDQVEQINQNQDQIDQNNLNQDSANQNGHNQDSSDQNSQNQDSIDQNNENQNQNSRNQDSIDQNNQNQEQKNQEDQSIRNEDQNEQVNQEGRRSRNEDQNEEQVEQRSQNQETITTRESTEDQGRENSNWNRNDQNPDQEQEQKQEAEQQQQLRDQAEQQQQQLPEEDKSNQKVEESEAQMAHEDEQKQQAERHNTAQQHQHQHKLDGHEFSDQTNNPDSKTDPDDADNSKSHHHHQNQDSSNGEAKQTTTNSDESNSGDSFPGGDNSVIPKESNESNTWSTQAVQSENQNERHASNGEEGLYGYTWQLCNETTGPDFIPCLDNEKALKRLRTTRHFQHRERHCPEDPPTCLVPLPEGYKSPITWPHSRDKIWYHNVPYTSLVDFKGHQNWVKVSGEFLTFPGGGTQFIHGAHYYIDFLQKAVPDISWGKHIRVTLDIGCGVASFGGYLFDKDVLTMSFAPKDEHEAQVQFALERGIPAISAVMGTQRLPFPARVFDLVHCARCRVPWHEDGGRLLVELNRVLRPGGYFVWSATPVYEKFGEDLQIWNEMSALTISMCFELVTIKRNKINKIAAAIYRKPTTNDCYEQRKHKSPPMCKNDDDANAAWYVPLQTCMHRVPVEPNERGAQWPEEWPGRVQEPPYWLNSSQMGIYGKPAPEDFSRDYVHWKGVVERSYMTGLGIDWSNVRNVMDMRAVYGGFAAALKDVKVWVLNVVNTDFPDTLPIIYERGLFGIYHDWCETFSSYPRTYDLLHADHLFSKLKKRCKVAPVMAEIDRMVRPGGKVIVRDEAEVIGEVESLLRSLHWEVRLIFSKNQQGLLSAQKTDWRPREFVCSSSSFID